MFKSGTAAKFAAIFLIAGALAACGGGGGGGGSAGAPVSAGGGDMGTTPPPPVASLNVVGTSVREGAVGIALDTTFYFTFNTQLSDAGFSGDRVQLSDGSTTYPVQISASGQILTVKPVANLHTKTDYHLTIKAGAAGSDGSMLKNDYVLNVTTAFAAYAFQKVAPADPSVHSGDLPRIIVADLNGDGRPDLVELAALNRPDLFAANGYVLNIYLQTATKEFVKLQRLEVIADQIPYSKYFNNLIALDIDGDNKPELLVPEYRTDDAATTGIRVFRAGSDGKFAAAEFIATNYAQKLQALDVDGDGKLDLVGSNPQAIDQVTGGFQVMLHTATGLTQLAPVTLPAGIYEFGAADIDRDGKNELIVNRVFAKPNNGPLTNELLIFSQGTAGVFSMNAALTNETAGFCTNADYCKDMRIVDWNGDRKPELVFSARTLGNGSTQNQVMAYTRQDGGGLSNDFQLSVGNDADVLAVQDMDHDGVPDVLLGGPDMSQQDPYFTVVVGKSDFSLAFSDVVPLPIADKMYPQNIAIADVDGDGHPDIIFDSYSSGIVIARHAN